MKFASVILKVALSAPVESALSSNSCSIRIIANVFNQIVHRCWYILYIGEIFASSKRVPSVFVEDFSNSAQFLNATCVAAVSGCFLWTWLPPAAAIVLVTSIFPVTKLYASE